MAGYEDRYWMSMCVRVWKEGDLGRMLLYMFVILFGTVCIRGLMEKVFIFVCMCMFWGVWGICMGN